ncbi:MAG TPA: transcriptional repressor LexA, partial [Chroococcales cyanobacterium]
MHRLPPRQREVLEILLTNRQKEGRIPTVREIALKLGVRAPGTITDHLKALEEKGFLVREPGKSRNIRLLVEPENDSRLPVVGRIAAGRPIEAIEDIETFSFFDDLDLSGVFLLKVKGDSMIEDCIADGDLVAIKPQNTARNGEIVVALLPDGEATLKR